MAEFDPVLRGGRAMLGAAPVAVGIAERLEVTGWLMTVPSRGQLLVDAGASVDAPGRGRFLACGTPEPAAVRS